MATSGDLRAAEESMRRLLADENLPEPDEVEYRETELVFLWHEMRTAVVVEVGGEGALPDASHTDEGDAAA